LQVAVVAEAEALTATAVVNMDFLVAEVVLVEFFT
jgi:hypothetical protein